ncbi:M6 family metalloprotease domain-containing protein [Lentimicrobium sp.]|uniref:InlB B-repeat-containing protein n=1 Tax=Lentimicrobium sp. TaxID=2034841 RepID=UPI002B97C3BC|nr:M6 family metalloprotease domain-containing protein [Lentimicrobium sp.]HPR26597.1 M6 family metalloprotease domain-containing protein [Lentimicrobium sp.]
MKKSLLLLLTIVFLSGMTVQADHVKNQPYQVSQPDGTVINCFVSGDEFFSWLHDADGYTIIQAPDGFYYYAISDKGTLRPTSHLAGQADPAALGLEKWAKISRLEYLRRKEAMEVGNNRSSRAPHQGTMNNLVIYIKFSDDSEFTTVRQTYDDLFNLPTGNSVKSYYTEVSYNQLTISSSHYPDCAMTTNLSYTDTHPRSYFEPYNATTNPNGYNGETQRRLREHALLRDAVNWINANSPVPGSLNIDGDNDGQVDNVCFVVRGGNGAWASLLWAHRWVLYSYNVFINGKQVWDYTFQPETQVNVRTLCHELFHALGAPDLYHYDDGGLNIDPAGNWDLMESGGGHMGAYMKWRYSENVWINAIPEITTSGTYTLNPLASSTNNCYKIASPNSTSEYYVVEYRQATGTFEGNLPGSGLLVYRIDPALNGNADGPPDEVYIYRPNGTTTTNGSPNSAYFSQQSGRTAINDGTNPSPFLQNGSAGGLNIYNITASGSTISFTVGMSGVANPSSFTASGVSETQIDLSWLLNASGDNVLLAWNTSPSFGTPVNSTAYTAGSAIEGGGTVLYSGNAQAYSHNGLTAGAVYYYRVWSADAALQYSGGLAASASTLCGQTALPYAAAFDDLTFPACWSQQVEGTNVANSWEVSSTFYAGGSANEMQSTYQNRNPGVSRLVMPPVNTTGAAALSLSFRHLLDDYGPGAVMRVQSSSDGINWTNESWSLATAGNNVIGPAVINTSIQNNLNSTTTYIAFSVDGNLYQYDYWFIDDVDVSISGYLSYNISASAVPEAGGTVSGAGTYNYASQAVLSAVPNTGYTFTNWTENGTVVSTDATYSFTVTGDRDLQANFSLMQCTISTVSVPVEGGICTGAGSYPYGAAATVTASPNTGYDFDHWMENGNIVSTEASYSFNVSDNRALQAVFSLTEYQVMLSAMPAEGGTVSGSGTYAHGAGVTVSATAAAGWTFVNWTENGNVVSPDPSYTFTITQNRTFVANFFPQVVMFTVVTEADPSEGGTTTGDGQYSQGSQATVSAIPADGWEFVAWMENGVIVSQSAVYTFVASSDRMLTASFTEFPLTYTISLTAVPAEGGTVEGAGTYTAGTSITVQALPADGFAFEYWALDGALLSADPLYTFTVSSDLSLEAVFVRQFIISATALPAEGGQTDGSGLYPENSMAVLMAIPNPGYHFVNWSEGGNVVSGEPEFAFQVNANHNLIANFQLSVDVSNQKTGSFRLYPNPSTGPVDVTAVGLIDSYALYSLTGRELLKGQESGLVSYLKLDLSGLPEGVYILKLVMVNQPPCSARVIIRR